MKKIALVAALTIASIHPVLAAQYDFDSSVNLCSQLTAKYVEPGFLAYVVNDGSDSNLSMFGTPNARFRFGFCMNYLGNPIHNVGGPE